MKKWMKIEEEVKGEQGLAALALGKFEEEYEIAGRLHWGTGARCARIREN
jgi:hypothetical protein